MYPLLKMEGILKTFPGVVAVDHVSLEVDAGEVLALIGENGAGKSTMMKILGGAHVPDSGKILLNGQEADVSTPQKALDSGISVIYQELNYLNYMSIAENLLMGRIPTKRFGRVDHKQLRVKSMEIQKLIGLDRYDPMTPLEDLSVGEKQLVEIGKAYARNVKVLVMDEPTSALNDKETERLFDLIDMVRAQGVAVIYISHKLDEIMRVSDRVQVMRDGKDVGTRLTKDVTKDELVTMMVGREIADMYPITPCEPGEPILELKHVDSGFLKDISFTLHKGEILGLYGLMGAGCDEILQCIFGARGISSGEILVNGKPITLNGPRDAVSAGMAYVPSERKTEGLVLIQSVLENITLSSIDDYGTALGMNKKKQRADAKEWAQHLNVKTASMETPVESLSGGNQQKVILAKWMLTHPAILLLNEPTKGIDVGAKVEIYKLIESFCREGLGVIMLSSEMAEVMNTANRTIVVYNGRITGEYPREEVTQEKIMRSAIGE